MKTFRIERPTDSLRGWRVFMGDQVTVAEVLTAAREFNLLVQVWNGEVALIQVNQNEVPPEPDELGRAMFGDRVAWAAVDELGDLEEETALAAEAGPMELTPIGTPEGQVLTVGELEEVRRHWPKDHIAPDADAIASSASFGSINSEKGDND